MTHSSAPYPEAAACPSDERLVAHLLEERSPDDPTAIATHLLDCDHCVAQVRVARSRLSLAAEIAAPVPHAVVARLQRPVTAARRFAFPTWRRLQSALRLPLLVPVAAAITLFVYAGYPTDRTTSLPEEQTRDVPLRQAARVTAGTAALHAAPDSAPGATRLERGTTVLLLAERDGWYQVELGDGTSGWMEKGAFD